MTLKPTRLFFFHLCLFVLTSYMSISATDILLENEMAKVFFIQETAGPGNKLAWEVNISTPAIDASRPETFVLTDLYLLFIGEALNDHMYAADQEGLHSKLEATGTGIAITLSGSSEKAQQLLLYIAEALKNPCLNEKKFKRYKSALLRKYRTASEDPIAQVRSLFRSIVYTDCPTEQQKATATRKTTFEELEKFACALFSEIHVEGSLCGGPSKQEAQQAMHQLIEILEASPYIRQGCADAAKPFENNPGPYFLDIKSKASANVALLAVESSPPTSTAWASQYVITQSLKDPFVSEFHNRQSAGDIILCHMEELGPRLFSVFLVKSSSHDGRDLLARFELFFENFLKAIESEMPKSSFEKTKTALISKLKQNSGQSLLLSKAGGPDICNKRLKSLEELTYRDFLKAAPEILGKQNRNRLAILLKGNVPEDRILQYKKCRSITQLKSGMHKILQDGEDRRAAG